MASIADIMHTNVQVTEEKVSVIEAVKKMKKLGVGSLVVVSNNEAIGIVTDSDVLYKAVAEELDLEKTTVSKIMSKPLISIHPEDSIDNAAFLMTKYKIKKLPVIDESGKLLGIVTATDLIRNSPEFSDILVQIRPPGGATFGA